MTNSDNDTRSVARIVKAARTVEGGGFMEPQPLEDLEAWGIPLIALELTSGSERFQREEVVGAIWRVSIPWIILAVRVRTV